MNEWSVPDDRQLTAMGTNKWSSLSLVVCPLLSLVWVQVTLDLHLCYLSDILLVCLYKSILFLFLWILYVVHCVEFSFFLHVQPTGLSGRVVWTLELDRLHMVTGSINSIIEFCLPFIILTIENFITMTRNALSIKGGSGRRANL